MATHSTIIPQLSSVEVVTSESDPQLSSVTSKSGTLSSTVLPPLSGDGEGGGSSSQSSVAAGIGGGIAAAVVLLIAVYSSGGSSTGVYVATEEGSGPAS